MGHSVRGKVGHVCWLHNLTNPKPCSCQNFTRTSHQQGSGTPQQLRHLSFAAAIDAIKLRVTWWRWHNARISVLVSGVTFECGVRNNPTVRPRIALNVPPGSPSLGQSIQASCKSRTRACRICGPCQHAHIGLGQCSDPNDCACCSRYRRRRTRRSRRRRRPPLARQSWRRWTASCGAGSPAATQVPLAPCEWVLHSACCAPALEPNRSSGVLPVEA